VQQFSRAWKRRGTMLAWKTRTAGGRCGSSRRTSPSPPAPCTSHHSSSTSSLQVTQVAKLLTPLSVRLLRLHPSRPSPALP